MDLQYFYQEQIKLLDRVSTKRKRYLYDEIDWDLKLIGILGQRGVGKTTMMLQQIKERFTQNQQALYISLDSPYFQALSLSEFAKEFEQYGGEVLYVDEVHKYPEWSNHIKHIYDTLDIRVVFSGSSILQIAKQDADLSRRAVVYQLENISFREYLLLYEIAEYDKVTLEALLKNHMELAANISRDIKPLRHFQEYLKYGAYPFALEDKKSYHSKIVQIVNTILEVDLPHINTIEMAQISKLKKLLYMLAVSVPFVPNITELSKATAISRPKIYEYLQYLEDAKIINSVRSKAKGYKIMSKPEKLFMQNTNISFALTAQIDTGSAREAFFVNQIKNYFAGKSRFLNNAIYTVQKGDFLVDNRYTFEIGGKNKSFEQIADMPDSFVVADEIEVGFGNKIPLWLFGMLY